MDSFESSNLRIWPLLLIFFLLILSGVSFYFYLKKPHRVSLPTENPIPVDIDTKIKNLYNISHASPASITKTTLIDNSSLPTELKNLIISGYYDLSMQQVVFVDGKNGYVLNFKVPDLIYLCEKYYAKLVADEKWTLISSMFNSQAGLRIMKTDKFRATIEEKVLDKKNLAITVTITD